MRYKQNKLKYESVNCRLCKQPFQRLIRKGNTKDICDREDCVKIKRRISALKSEKPVGFDGLPNTPSRYTSDINYHGVPNK